MTQCMSSPAWFSAKPVLKLSIALTEASLDISQLLNTGNILVLNTNWKYFPLLTFVGEAL